MIFRTTFLATFLLGAIGWDCQLPSLKTELTKSGAACLSIPKDVTIIYGVAGPGLSDVTVPDGHQLRRAARARMARRTL